MSNPDIFWVGVSGQQYGYWIHPINTPLLDEPGNYIYAKEIAQNEWCPLYIGQTSSLRDRLENHEKEQCAIKNGATHIHAHTSSSSEDTRKMEEIDLIKGHIPVCNELHT